MIYYHSHDFYCDNNKKIDAILGADTIKKLQSDRTSNLFLSNK